MSPKRSVRTLLLAVALAVGASGCAWGTGLNAETARERSPIQGVDGTAGSVALRNFMIVPASGLPGAGGGGYLIGTLVNSGPGSDALVGLTSNQGPLTVRPAAATGASASPGTPTPTVSPKRRTPSPTPSASATAAATALPLVLRPSTIVQFTAPGVGGPGASVLVPSSVNLATPSGPFLITFSFASGAQTTLNVPINSYPGTSQTETPIPAVSYTPSPVPTPGLLSPSSEIQPTASPS